MSGVLVDLGESDDGVDDFQFILQFVDGEWELVDVRLELFHVTLEFINSFYLFL